MGFFHKEYVLRKAHESVRDYLNQSFDEASELEPAGSSYTNCQFTACDLSDLAFDGILDTCAFHDCNLSLTSFTGAMLQGVSFIRCKLVGVDFTRCNALGLALHFAECLIRSCNFNLLDLRKTQYVQCDIVESDFMETNLKEANFSHTGFRTVTFHNTILVKANFTGATGYQINPLNNQIKDAVFSLPDAIVLLECMGVKLL